MSESGRDSGARAAGTGVKVAVVPKFAVHQSSGGIKAYFVFDIECAKRPISSIIVASALRPPIKIGLLAGVIVCPFASPIPRR
jgi:hypothetical protein